MYLHNFLLIIITFRNDAQLIKKENIRKIVTQIDPNFSIDTEAEDALLELANDFVESITKTGCQMAQHRSSSIVQKEDILLHLQKFWNIELEDVPLAQPKQMVPDSHQKHLDMVRRDNLRNKQ